jgi:glycosyltransferase involved in cell wall biosynthesis
MKVAVINTFDVKDIKNWSGIPFHLSVFLERFFGRDHIDFVAIPLKRGVLSYLKGFYYNRVKKLNYLSDFDGDVLAANDKAFEGVRNKGYDVIITFQFFIIPNLKNPKSKIIFWSDATFQNLLNYYQYVSNLPSSGIKRIHAIQKEALKISDAVIFSSQWAGDSAVQRYETDPRKLNIIPFASNLNSLPSPAEIASFIEKRNLSPLKLLFLGVDWERKGGDDAVKVLNNLNQKGIRAVLYAVGVEVPATYADNPNIISTGFINKNIAEGEAKIIELLKESTFLILPTKADCTPVVFSEANSYGLPVITTTVGGIASVVSADVNGCCFAIDDFVTGATAFIEKYGAASDAYRQLCLNSYRYYNEALSWDNLEEKFKTVLTALIK